jgi:hypothetical protein
MYRDRETRVGNVSFTYRFGGSDNEHKPAAKTNGNGGRRKSQQNNGEKDKERQNLKTDESSSDQGSL